MGRIYISYTNPDEGIMHGYTWSTITALTLGAHGAPLTARQIADEIWGDPTSTPLDVHQQVTSCLNKLCDQGFAIWRKAPAGSRSHYAYELTTQGIAQFQPPADFKASDYSDSKIFRQPTRPRTKKAKKGRVIKFKKAG